MVMHLAFAGERAHSSVRLPGATLHVYQLYIKIGLCYIYRNHPPSIYPGAEKKSYPGEEVECVLIVLFVAKSSSPRFSVCYGACLLLTGEVSSTSGLRSKTTYQNGLYPVQKASQAQTLKKDKTFSCRGL